MPPLSPAAPSHDATNYVTVSCVRYRRSEVEGSRHGEQFADDNVEETQRGETAEEELIETTPRTGDGADDDQLLTPLEYRQSLDKTSLAESGGTTRRLCIRRIVAEDERWTLSIVPSLADICVRHIADNFCCNSLIYIVYSTSTIVGHIDFTSVKEGTESV